MMRHVTHYTRLSALRTGLLIALLAATVACAERTTTDSVQDEDSPGETPTADRAHGSRAGRDAAASAIRVVEIRSPAGAGSGEPNISSAGGDAWLSWLDKTSPNSHALRLSRWDGDGWTPPVTVVSDVPFFANWADFPSVLPMRDGGLVAHWLQRSGEGTYDYDVMVSRSGDAGATWSAPVRPHRDGTKSEHGFVSLVDFGPGRFGAIWLDGRNFKEGAATAVADMMLMFAVFEGGAFRPEAVLDERVCECCQTAVAAVQDGIFVAYRDRSPDEVRDISIVRGETGSWTEPAIPHADGWKIAGCPVNGPSVASDGDRVAVAWFTAANGRGHVKVAFSEDGGRTFCTPVRMDQGKPLGRVDVEWLADGSALVCWLEEGGSAAEIRVQKAVPDGLVGDAAVVARTSVSRASGFPRMTRLEKEILLAWTDTADPRRVRVARVLP